MVSHVYKVRPFYELPLHLGDQALILLMFLARTYSFFLNLCFKLQALFSVISGVTFNACMKCAADEARRHTPLCAPAASR